MKALSLLIKPASGNCQMRCRYCFYENVTSSRAVANYGLMSLATLETLVAQAIAETDEMCTFSFQGGEPTLVGLDFYRSLIQFQKQYQEKYQKRRLIIRNTLQTNGLLLDDDWGSFLAGHHFLVGLSLDGDKAIHDANRLDAAGKGTYNRVLQAARLLARHQVEYNILCVVTSEMARHAKQVYRSLLKNGFQYLQFIPCIDDFGTTPGANPFSLSAGRFAEFLKNLFDEWYLDLQKGQYTSIRHFDNWVHMLQGQPPESCSMSGQCTSYGVIEADGSVYPCDFYVLDQWRLGNIREQSFSSLLNSEQAGQFVRASQPVAAKCQACRFFSICRGGCRRDREPLDEQAGTLNVYCAAYEQFFTYALDRLHAVARTVR